MNKNKKIHWLGVFIYLIFQVFALFFMRGLEHRNMETLFFSGKGLKDYRQFLNTFKEQKTILVKTNFPKGLTEAGYQDFETALRNLREKFPEVEVLGFFDVYKLAVKKDELSSVQEFIRNKPDLHLKFVGPDYLVFLSVFKEDVSPKEIQSFISQLQAQPFFSGQKVQIAGLPYINYLLDQYSGDIKTKLFPILFAVVFLATLLFTRDFLSSLILFIPALGSLSLTLAFTRQIYSSMNMVTSIVPLLIFVLNLSLAFHFYFAFLEYGSMRRALREKKIPFLLMVSTTAIGFGSLALSDIPAIREFGVLSFLSILLSSGLTFLWAYSLFPWRIEKEPKNLLAWVPASLFYNTWSRRIIVLLSLLLIPSSIWFFPKIPLNTDATSYFPKKSGLQENIRAVERELLGIPIAEVELLKKDRGEIDYDDLLILDKLENEILRDLEGHGGIISANQVIEEANYLYTGEKKLPPFELSYDTLKSQTLPVFQRQYPVQQRYRLTILGPSMNYGPYQEELGRIQKIIAKYPQFQATIGGIYFHIMQAQSSLIFILTVSFFWRILVMALLFFLYFRKFRLLVVFLLSNEFPVFACILFLYVCRFSLNIATVMVFPVAIGIVVGNTFHIIHALTKRQLPTFEEYFNTIVIPVLIGTMTLVLGFAVLSFYGFVPIQQFGGALAFTVFMGMISALYIVPSLITKSTDLRGFLSRPREVS